MGSMRFAIGLRCSPQAAEGHQLRYQMADDSNIQRSLSDLNRRSLTGSGSPEESAAEHDYKQGATAQDIGDQEERPRYRIAWDEFKYLFCGNQARHRRLHGRLIGILVLSLLVNFAATGLLSFIFVDSFSEKPDTSIYRVARAFAWTSSQMLVGGSSYPPQTGAAHFFEVLLQGYGVTVIAAIAGAFASYFMSGDT